MKGLKHAMSALAVGAAMSALSHGPAALAEAGRASGPAVSEFKLANGLDVVVIPDHRTPVVTHMVWYKVGSADEEMGKSGIAHFLEHLMFKGTEKHPAGQFSDVVAELGGTENAFTSNDYTAYFQRTAKEHLKTLMEFEADRMTGLVLTDEVVAPERDVVLEERRMRTDTDPAAQLSESISATLFVNHPYGIPIIGWDHEIRKLGRDQAIEFYERYYTPSNAILVVAGDVTAEEVKVLAEETYGKVPNRFTVAERVRPTEPDPRTERRVVMRDAKVRQPNLSRSYLVPSYRTAKPGEAEALDVLAQILGGGSTSRLYKALVVDGKVAASAGAYYQGSALDATRLAVYASPREGVTLEALETALDAAVAKLATEGVSEEELGRAKTRLIADAVYSQDNQSTLARIYGVALTTGLTVDDVRDWPDKIRKVTADEVKAAAASYLQAKRSVTGLLAPEQKS